MEDGSWTSQTERLLIMDARDFNLVGIGLDDLIEVRRFLRHRKVDLGSWPAEEGIRIDHSLQESQSRC